MTQAPPAKNTSVSRESLSAAIDGQLGHEELRFALRRMEHDATLAESWGRWHLARDSLRGDLPTLASVAFADRVMRALDADQASASTAAAHQGARGRWLKLSAGGAIAAGVAVAALMVGQPVANDGGHEVQFPTTLTASASRPAPEASVTPLPAAPAAVPAWLSSSNAFRYSQQASATVGGAGSGFDNQATFGRALAPYQVQGYRTVPSPDGSYLLLVDPSAQRAERLRSAASR